MTVVLGRGFGVDAQVNVCVIVLVIHSNMVAVSVVLQC